LRKRRIRKNYSKKQAVVTKKLKKGDGGKGAKPLSPSEGEDSHRNTLDNGGKAEAKKKGGGRTKRGLGKQVSWENILQKYF